MATIEEFANPPGWNIKSWEVDQAGKVPTHAMTIAGGVVIAITSPETCTVTWLDQDRRLCSIRDIPFVSETGMLQARAFPVSFGESGIIVCKVDLWLDDKGLLGGRLETGNKSIDGNTGTFAAEAHPGPPIAGPS
jgi:hypothetical protein